MLSATLLESSPAQLRSPVTGTFGRYVVGSVVGAGANGVVHEAIDVDLDRRVALKIVGAATSSRLLREARAMARLHHPNVVTVYEIGTSSGRDYIAMEFVDGMTLAEWLRAAPRSVEEIVRAFVDAARGLDAAHAAGVVHRDFKPHNVLRSHDGRVAVTDFGLAREPQTMFARGSARDVESHATLTQTGVWVGTPAYMAPEQWNGGVVTPATDQFAFCVALWEALAGERPFRGETTDELRAATERGLSPLDLKKIPRRYRALLARGLDRDPTKRWLGMGMVANLLESHVKSRAWIWWIAAASFLFGAIIETAYLFGPYIAHAIRTLPD